MSVIESERRASAHRRLIPLGARFAPSLLAEICAEVRGHEESPERGMLGLLFGKTERNVVNLEAFLGVTADCTSDARSPDSERLERALDAMLSKSKLQPELTSLELVGWCFVQSTEHFGDVPKACGDFHTRRFRRASDVLLIVRQGSQRELSARLYARLSDLPLSPEHYASSGSIAIALEARATQPLDVPISGSPESTNSELYFRTYEFVRALEKAERKEARREALRRVVDWRTPQWLSSIRSETAVAPELSPAIVSTPKPATPELAVVRPFADEQATRPHRASRLPWIIYAAVFLVSSGLAFLFLYPRIGPSRSSPATQVLRTAPQNAGLGLRIHVQGDAFLITWDRDAPAVRSATKAVLRIEDGSQSRHTDLEPAELANGSILYKPASNDVDFQLTVYAAAGAAVREGVRALDGTSGPRAAAPADVPQLVPAAIRQVPIQPKRSAVLVRGRSTEGSPNQPVPPPGTASDYIAPRPLKVAMPDVAHLAATSLPATGRIEVEVEIDKLGHVTAARIPAGAPKISVEAARAAIAAAQQWRFEPAKLHGQSIASTHRVVFDLSPGTR